MKKIYYIVLELIICINLTACSLFSSITDDTSSVQQTQEKTTGEAAEDSAQNSYDELIYESDRAKISFYGIDFQRGKYKINLFVENLTDDTLWITSDTLIVSGVNIPVKDDYYIESGEKSVVQFNFRESYIKDAGIADFDNLEIELLLTDLRYNGLLSSTYEEKTGMLKITLYR